MCNSDIAEHDIISQTRNLEGNLIFSCSSTDSRDLAHTRSFCLLGVWNSSKGDSSEKVLFTNPELSIWLSLDRKKYELSIVLRIILALGVVYSLLLWCYPLDGAGQSYVRLIYLWLLAFLITSLLPGVFVKGPWYYDFCKFWYFVSSTRSIIQRFSLIMGCTPPMLLKDVPSAIETRLWVIPPFNIPTAKFLVSTLYSLTMMLRWKMLRWSSILLDPVILGTT